METLKTKQQLKKKKRRKKILKKGIEEEIKRVKLRKKREELKK